MKHFFVYILECSDSSFYVGHTDNLESRLSEHMHGKVNGYTASRLPLKLVYSQEFSERADALIAERQIKGWSRKKKMALIAGNWNKLVELSNKK